MYGIERGERVDDVVFEKMFGDPREELLKFITRELYKVVNVNVNRYKMVMTMMEVRMVLKRQKDQGLLASSIKKMMMNRSWI